MSEEAEVKSEAVEKQTGWISETVALAVITALSYVYAFAYEYEYCRAFGIPSDLIQIDTVRVIVIALTMLVFSIFAFFIYGPIHTAIFTPSIKRSSRVWRMVFTVLMLGFIIWVNSHTGLTLVAILLVILSIFVDSEMAKRGLSHFEEEGKQSALLFKTMRELAGVYPLNCSIYAIIVLVAVGSAGRGEAVRQRTYFVPTSQPGLVLIKTYGETMIFAKFDASKEEIYKELSLYPLDSDVSKNLQLKTLKKPAIVSP